jgi:hypothetical protein
MDGAETPRRRNPLRRAFKAVLHVIVKAIILTRRAVRRYPIPALIVLTIILGTYFAVSTGMVPLTALGVAPAEYHDARLASIERYLEGQKNADVTMMWEAVSEEMRADEEAFADTQRRVTMAKLNGINFVDEKYVGGSNLADGGSVHLYVISITNGSQNGQFPLTFTLNQSGKIARIE